MCITSEMLDDIQKTLTQSNQLGSNPLPILKECFPGVTFVRMSASDVDDSPYVSMDQFNLYLLDGREHCVQLTHNLEHATGVVVASKQ